MVKITQRWSDLAWSAIFSVIIYRADRKFAKILIIPLLDPLTIMLQMKITLSQRK